MIPTVRPQTLEIPLPIKNVLTEPKTKFKEEGKTHSNWFTEGVYWFGRKMIAIAHDGLTKLLSLGKPWEENVAGREKTTLAEYGKRIKLGVSGSLELLLGVPLAIIGFSIMWCCNLTRDDFTFIQPAKPPKLEKDLSNSIKTNGFKVTTFNVGSLPDYATGPNKLRSVEERMEELVNRINNLPYDEQSDCICLQELFDEDAIKLLLEKIDKKKYPYIVAGAGRSNDLLMNSGLCIISKYPIKEPTFWGYTNLVGIDNASHKGVLGACIQLSETHAVRVFNTHLQAEEANVQARKEELEAIGRLYDSYQPQLEGIKTIATITCGDINIGKYKERRDEKTHKLVPNKEWEANRAFFEDRNYQYYHDPEKEEEYVGSTWDMSSPHTGWNQLRKSEWVTKAELVDHILVMKEEGQAPLQGRVRLIRDGMSLSSDHLAVQGIFNLTTNPIDYTYDPINT